MELEILDSKCFLCGKKQPVFDTESRICTCIRLLGFPENEQACYVSRLPELKNYSITSLPSIWATNPPEVFAVAADNLGMSEEAVTRQRKIANGDGGIYPYSTDVLNTRHFLRCGNSMIYRSASLEDLTGSEQVFVLDMGPYYWSGTLKDPRSWAILNTALSSDIRDIAVWTAGNAGVSLAKLAYFANRRLPPESRLQIYAIVDNDIAPEIAAQLRLWQSEVLDVFRQDKPVLNPPEIRNLVATRLRRSRRRLEDAHYWHVTDGWEGVGLLMYRLIAAQVIRDLCGVMSEGQSSPLDIVLPVGTGNLLLGFYLGMKDCMQAGLISHDACRMVGILPFGANILNNIRQRSIPVLRNDSGPNPNNSVVPLMPKLNGLYTPLAPCIAQIDKEGGIEFVVVTAADQLRASRQLLSGGIDDGIVAEPSALATFAALPHLSDARRHGNGGQGRIYKSKRRTLVINSGLGILGRSEEVMLHQAIGIGNT